MNGNHTNATVKLTNFPTGLISVVFCLVVVVASGQQYSKEVEFARIGVEAGLSNSNVTCILQDRKGFLWVGTADGLNKFNGYDFKVYRHREEDITSLIKNDIACNICHI